MEQKVSVQSKGKSRNAKRGKKFEKTDHTITKESGIKIDDTGATKEVLKPIAVVTKTHAGVKRASDQKNEALAYKGADASYYKSSKHQEDTWMARVDEVESLQRAVAELKAGGKVVLMAPEVATGHDWRKRWSLASGLELEGRWFPYRGVEPPNAETLKMMDEKNLILAPSLSTQSIAGFKERGFSVYTMTTSSRHIMNATRGRTGEDVNKVTIDRDRNFKDRQNIKLLMAEDGNVKGIIDGTCLAMVDLFKAVKENEESRVPSAQVANANMKTLSDINEMSDDEQACSHVGEKTTEIQTTDSAVATAEAGASPGNSEVTA